MKQIEEGHPTPSSSPITIFGIAHGPDKVRRSNFLTLAFHEYFVFSCLIRKGTNLGPADSSGDTYYRSILVHILYLSKSPPSLSYRTHHNLQPFAVVEKIAIQSRAIPSSHCNYATRT